VHVTGVHATEPLGDDDLDRLASAIDGWLAEVLAEHDRVLAVDRATGDVRRWYVRMQGTDKEFTTVWLTLGQRTLRYETHVMPAPEDNHSTVFERLLRRNERLVGAHFSIGAEDAVFLRGELFVAHVDRDEIDRVLGTLYDEVERSFRSLLRTGFPRFFAV
jgi:hypothetical protein